MMSKPNDIHRELLIIDDHPIMIDGLNFMFHAAGFRIQISSAGSIQQAIAKFRKSDWFSLILLDGSLLNDQSVNSIERIKAEIADIPIVVLTPDDDLDTIERVLYLGAMGAISRRSQGKVIIQAIQSVLAGGTCLPEQVLRHVPAIAPELTKPQQTLKASESFGLTARQLDVLDLLLEGKSNKVICRELRIAEGTVKAHIAAIMRVLKVKRRAEVPSAVRHMSEQN